MKQELRVEIDDAKQTMDFDGKMEAPALLAVAVKLIEIATEGMSENKKAAIMCRIIEEITPETIKESDAEMLIDEALRRAKKGC